MGSKIHRTQDCFLSVLHLPFCNLLCNARLGACKLHFLCQLCSHYVLSVRGTAGRWAGRRKKEAFLVYTRKLDAGAGICDSKECQKPWWQCHLFDSCSTCSERTSKKQLPFLGLNTHFPFCSSSIHTCLFCSPTLATPLWTLSCIPLSLKYLT